MSDFLMDFLNNTGFLLVDYRHLVMICVAFSALYLGIVKHYAPLWLVPVGFGLLMGNVPVFTGSGLGIHEEGSLLNFLYQGVAQGIYPPLIFMGIGAMSDFSTLLARPSLMLLGAATQAGIFLAFLAALLIGFSPQEAASIGIIGGADGPIAIYLTSWLAPELIGPIAMAVYACMALVPVIQPPIVLLLTTGKERRIRMQEPGIVSQKEKILFPIVGFLLCCFIVPAALPLLGMFFLGNLLKEAVVTERLAIAARTVVIDTLTILLGVTVGASTRADIFLTGKSLGIFALGMASFAIATAAGVLFAKFMNLFMKEKINPIIGAAGVSAVPDAARVAHVIAQKEDPGNFLLRHAMAPNIAGLIGSVITAAVLWSFLS